MDAAAMQADNTGIVTERDVMRAFSEHGPSAFAMPVVALMSYPLHVVQANALAYAAIGRMNRLQVRHLGVADRAGRVAGVLSSRDLLRLRAEGAVELADEIGSARDVHDLARAWARLAQIAGELLAEGLSASDVAAVVSQRVREMTYLAAEQAEAAMKAEGLGEPPCRYAVLVLGSAGRDESLLAMDQDNAIVFADDSPDGADVWFAELGRRMTDTLHAVGIPLCKGGVMARNPAWRGSYATWCQRVQRWISNASPESLLSVDIFFDLRAAYGDIALAQRLRAFAFDTARGDAAFAKLLLQAEGFVPSGLTWYGGIKTDQGRIDLKKAGLFGVVSAARALAICHHVTGHSTPERLRSLAALEIGGGEDIDALADARDVGERAVRLARAFRHVHDRPSEQRHQFVHAMRAPATDVEYFAGKFRLRRQTKGLDDIADESKIARLRAVAHDGERLALPLLREEHPEHGAVGARGPSARAEDVEEPQRDHR